MQKALISVIVPVYKVEKFLPRSIESVQKQTFQDWEMILIDDGSPDQCGEICDHYAGQDARIHVIHQKNGGVSAARNEGLKAAGGEFLYFLDPDDYLLPQALEEMYRALNETRADMVMAGHDRIEAGGKIHRDYADWPIYADTLTIQRAFLRNDLPNFVWGKLYKRELWEGIRFPENITMEDLYILPSAAFRAEKIVIMPESLYIYSHENETSIMTGFDRSYIRLHYNRWLAWREHERLAVRYAEEEQDFCAEKAIHASVRAVMLNMGQGLLTDNEIEMIRDYLSKHRNGSMGLKAGSFLIRHNCLAALSVLGKFQRMIAEKQQRRRIRKLRRRQEQ